MNNSHELVSSRFSLLKTNNLCILEQNSNETAAIYEPHCTYLIFGAQNAYTISVNRWHIIFSKLHTFLLKTNLHVTFI